VLRKLGHPSTARDASDEPSGQTETEAPADGNPDDPDYKVKSRDRA
jgi:hypothetical protein